MARTKHARRTPNKALAAVGVTILAGMALVMPNVLADEDTGHGIVPPESPGEHIRTATELPKLDGLPTRATAVNDHGVAVGYGEDERNARAVVWENGEIRALDNLPGGDFAQAHDINDSGQIVGRAGTEEGSIHAVLWEPDGAIKDLGTIDDVPGRSGATAINNAGQVVGSSYYGDGRNIHGFLWEGGELRDLGISNARDINDNGDIVGIDGAKSVLIRDGETTVLADGAGSLEAIGAVNGNGHVGGSLERTEGPSTGRNFATVWLDGDPEQAVELPGTPHDSASWVSGVNDNDVAVGTASDVDPASDKRQAMLWSSLDDPQRILLDPPEGHDFAEAEDINDHGVVVGNASTGDGPDPVIWQY